MAKANQNYLQLPGNYLFSTIAQKVRDYQESYPGTEVIRLGIGDVTQPIAPEIIRALHSAVDEMGQADTFRGYAPDLGSSSTGPASIILPGTSSARCAPHSSKRKRNWDIFLWRLN